ncbi:jg827, partial [Pararge aegeria aegeria]
KSLFDGLEESDPSIEDKLTLKPSRKRLVLRPKPRTEDNESIEHADNDRSLEEPRREANDSQEQGQPVASTQQDSPGSKQEFISIRAEKERGAENNADNNNSEGAFDRHSSWLGPKQGWSEKDMPAEIEPTPRLYPNLGDYVH